MTKISGDNQAELKTIFAECRQCGTCCKSYRKITLHKDEVDFIEKMGGHVGVEFSLRDLTTSSIETIAAEARGSKNVYMVHPDEKGCVFLEKRNKKHFCKIYHYRPRACKGFRCTLADSSFDDLFGKDSIYLLGENSFGLPLANKK